MIEKSKSISTLIVDDSNIARKIARKVLSESHHQWDIHEAEDGEDALRRQTCS